MVGDLELKAAGAMSESNKIKRKLKFEYLSWGDGNEWKK